MIYHNLITFCTLFVVLWSHHIGNRTSRNWSPSNYSYDALTSDRGDLSILSKLCYDLPQLYLPFARFSLYYDVITSEIGRLEIGAHLIIFYGDYNIRNTNNDSNIGNGPAPVITLLEFTMIGDQRQLLSWRFADFIVVLWVPRLVSGFYFLTFWCKWLAVAFIRIPIQI